MKFEYPLGATPLDQDEIAGLIPKHITIQSELNEWEAVNILEAETWLFSITNTGNFLTLEFIKSLHKKMFSKTWKWPGSFRKTEKNIGVAPYKISAELQILLDNVTYQINHASYPIDEIAYRFHHRLVCIHPFPNGNGRHARMMTDLLLSQARLQKFSWGSTNLQAEGSSRKQYLKALRKADSHDYTALRDFVRS